MLPLIAALLPVLLIFLGFAVDLAYMQTTRLELQAAADSAARAGATQLSQTDDATSARNFAKDIARQNLVAGAPLLLRNSDVRIGRSDRNANGSWIFRAGGKPSNAVRVVAPRTVGSRSGAVRLFFGSLIGRPNFEPSQAATASFLNVDICLVLDRSSSMKLGVTEGEHGLSSADGRLCSPPNAASRWKALDAAVRVFLSELNDTDADEHVALVTYSSDLSGSSICGASSQPATLDSSLNADLTRISKAMDRLLTNVWNGNTYIEAGMRTGLAALQDAKLARKSAEQMMIVLTDGNENVGSAMSAARDCSAAGIRVYTITFGDGANQTLMENVAQEAGGAHYHATSASSLARVFRELAAQAAQLTE
jgi:Flp pilus assembly protein TadG